MKGKVDRRDPQKLGELYLEMRRGGVPIDVAVRMPVENYPEDESLCVQTAREYQAYLADLADRGDANACALRLSTPKDRN